MLPFLGAGEGVLFFHKLPRVYSGKVPSRYAMTEVMEGLYDDMAAERIVCLCGDNLRYALRTTVPEQLLFPGMHDGAVKLSAPRIYTFEDISSIVQVPVDDVKNIIFSARMRINDTVGF